MIRDGYQPWEVDAIDPVTGKRSRHRPARSRQGVIQARPSGPGGQYPKVEVPMTFDPELELLARHRRKGSGRRGGSDKQARSLSCSQIRCASAGEGRRDGGAQLRSPRP